jgi:hypothetical protein
MMIRMIMMRKMKKIILSFIILILSPVRGPTAIV